MGQVALQARAPQPDLAAIERAAQGANARDYELQNAPQRSQLEALKLQGDIGQESALAQYRKAQGAGDPKALDTLNAYPKIQKDMYDVFDGASPEAFMFGRKQAKAFGRAAQYVLSFPKDSPERKEAWDESIKVLREEHFIDDRQMKQMLSAGPSDLILQQALTVDDYVKSYAGKNSKVNDAEYQSLRRQKIQAEIDKLKAGKPAGKATNQNSLLIAANRELGAWERENLPTPEELAKKKAEIWARHGLPADVPLAESGPGKADKGAPAVKPAPATDIPQGAIDMLLKDPTLAAKFDEKYGEGASESILGGQ